MFVHQSISVCFNLIQLNSCFKNKPITFARNQTADLIVEGYLNNTRLTLIGGECATKRNKLLVCKRADLKSEDKHSFLCEHLCKSFQTVPMVSPEGVDKRKKMLVLVL